MSNVLKEIVEYSYLFYSQVVKAFHISTLKAPTPYYAYKVTYLGYFKNDPNARLAPDSIGSYQNNSATANLTDEINAFPNPFSNQVQINAPISIADVFVYDVRVA
jgi:hypothetical protein